jgi:uncharacterized protein YbbC (DUF1343 family)
MTKHILSIFLSIFSLSCFALDYGLDRVNEPAIAAKIQGKTLAVLTHAAARTKAGEHLIDILFQNYDLQKIFAPEHGLRTMADDWVGDGTDETTGLPVISLYKRGTRAPNATDLQGIDAVVVDLQDVGVRYYTYFSTIAEVMKACAASNVEVILLDRPNLLGGLIVEGKVLEASLAGSFTAYHTVPTRHGMTLGELALMINAEQKLNVKLTVIPASGWSRESLLTNTERPWIAPSPALIELPQVGLYAIWGTLENFNLAVGRGTTNELAFKVIGAPWITPAESVKLAADLNKLGFKGATFTPYNWKVTRALHVGKEAYGVKLTWTGEEIRTDEFTYKVSSHLVNQFKTRINSSNMSPQSYGSTSMVNAIRSGTSWEKFSKVIDPELEAFKIRRLPYLLY